MQVVCMRMQVMRITMQDKCKLECIFDKNHEQRNVSFDEGDSIATSGLPPGGVATCLKRIHLTFDE